MKFQDEAQVLMFSQLDSRADGTNRRFIVPTLTEEFVRLFSHYHI
jgi:hypothetical protein